MNEPSQIRERFLADARRHLFSGDQNSGSLQGANRPGDKSYCHTDALHCGPTGA